MIQLHRYSCKRTIEIPILFWQTQQRTLDATWCHVLCKHWPTNGLRIFLSWYLFGIPLGQIVPLWDNWLQQIVCRHFRRDPVFTTGLTSTWYPWVQIPFRRYAYTLCPDEDKKKVALQFSWCIHRLNFSPDPFTCGKTLYSSPLVCLLALPLPFPVSAASRSKVPAVQSWAKVIPNSTANRAQFKVSGFYQRTVCCSWTRRVRDNDTLGN